MNKVNSLSSTNDIVHPRFIYVAVRCIETSLAYLTTADEYQRIASFRGRSLSQASYTQRTETCATKLEARGKNGNVNRHSLYQGCH
jgi:hypothetical protein